MPINRLRMKRKPTRFKFKDIMIPSGNLKNEKRTLEEMYKRRKIVKSIYGKDKEFISLATGLNKFIVNEYVQLLNNIHNNP